MYYDNFVSDENNAQQKRRVLIITDEAQSIQSIARSISNVLTNCNVKILTAQEFSGDDLLPAEIFFIGCENPNPSSFAYLEELLLHINLVSRKCGIFSTNKKTLDYLQNIVKDSETGLFEPLLVGNAVKDSNIENWLKNKI
jgi:hypothetical protein